MQDLELNSTQHEEPQHFVLEFIVLNTAKRIKQYAIPKMPKGTSESAKQYLKVTTAY